MYLIAAAVITPLAVPRYWMVVLASAFCAGFFAFVSVGNAMSVVDANGTPWPSIVELMIQPLVAGGEFLALGSALYWGKRAVFYAMGRRRPKVVSNID